ncbi:hypothetical protein VPHD372_0192 [Vibrio phage D372]
MKLLFGAEYQIKLDICELVGVNPPAPRASLSQIRGTNVINWGIRILLGAHATQKRSF